MNKNYMSLNYNIICRFDWFTLYEHTKLDLLDVHNLDTNKQYYLLKINDDYEIKYDNLEKAKKEFKDCINNVLESKK